MEKWKKVKAFEIKQKLWKPLLSDNRYKTKFLYKKAIMNKNTERSFTLCISNKILLLQILLVKVYLKEMFIRIN